MEQLIAPKTAIVTGASRGIGRGISLVLAKHGYDVMIAHLNEPNEAEDTARQIRERFGQKAVTFQSDLRDTTTLEALVDSAYKELGSIGILVNNAGICIRDKIVTDFSQEKIDAMTAINFRAPLLLSGLTAKRMIADGVRGNMIFISSSRAQRAYPMDGVYGGLKAALERAAMSIALELAPHGIRVNAIAPGATIIRNPNDDYHRQLSRKIPLGRMGMPEDIGEAVAWLCSESASYITGVTLRIDGGLILPGMPEETLKNPEDGWGRVT
jgi:glucose 1-dehydrogenase